MATSGLVSAIHAFDFSKPEKTRFQYGSSVCLLSIAAPMAGTCDEATPAVILATFRPRLAGCLRFRFGLARRLASARLGAIAFYRTAAIRHNLGVVLFR